MARADVVPPTVLLPPLKLLKTCAAGEIETALAALRYIYLPEVRGSRRRRRYVPRWGHAGDGSEVDEEDSGSDSLAAIRADAFERSFAIQWLTRFVALFSEDTSDAAGAQMLEAAASLLAICAGTAAAGAITRTFTFACPFSSTFAAGPHPPTDEISVTLRDAPLESSDVSSVGMQTWGGSCILAEMIAEAPHAFSVFPREHDPAHDPVRAPGPPLCPPGTSPAPFRALELGAGTGLASIVLGKVLTRIRDAPPRRAKRRAHDDDDHKERPCTASPASTAAPVDLVLATDFHASVLANLRVNLAVNFSPRYTHARDDDDDVEAQAQAYACAAGPGAEASGGLPTQRCGGSGPGRVRMEAVPLDWCAVQAVTCPSRGDRNDDHGGVQDTSESETLASPPSSRRDVDADDTALSLRGSQAPCNVHRAAHVEPSASAGLLAEPFDVVLGADIIYEREHARWVRTCVERFLRKPSELLPPAVFHLMIPLRRTHGVETRTVEEVFGGVGSAGGAVGLELGILSGEDVVCDAYGDGEGGEEVVYRYYRIGWV